MSLNKVFLLGNLGADPEIRTTQSGASVVNLRLATNGRWVGRDGEHNERTDWHRIVVFGKAADNCAQYLSKGRQVLVEGSIQNRQWEDQEGNKHYATEIVAKKVDFIGSRRNLIQ